MISLGVLLSQGVGLSRHKLYILYYRRHVVEDDLLIEL